MRRPTALAAIALLALPAHAEESLLRLGADVVPRSQELRLRVDARQSEYSGTATIALDVKTPATSFRLHAQGLTIGSVELLRRGKPVTAGHEQLGEDQLQVTAGEPLVPGAGYELRIAFTNDFDTQANALYKVERDGASYLFTQFQDVHAREAFPCWDEPAFKIPWRVILEVPMGDLALSNTRIERERAEGEWKTLTFRKSPPMPSYLVAIATGPLETVDIPGLRVPARVVVPKGMAAQAQDAAQSCPPLLRALESWFGSPYPYDKLDLLAVPEFWYGAMENAGAITFRDTILLIDSATGSEEQRESMRETLAHELAHMWFGDLVTMEWWDDLWLNESFATWMATKAMDEVWPEALFGARQVGAVQFAMGLDSLPSSRAIRQRVDKQSALLESADALAYEKGQAILVMTESWLGEDAFRRGVLRYLREHEWGNARGDDLWNALSKASGRDVGAVMTSFLDQPGVPLIEARVLPGGKARLSQRRYISAGLSAPEAQLWRAPVTVKFDAGRGAETRTLLLQGEATEVHLGAGDVAWLHPNAGESAYARWMLDEQALSRLVAARPKLDLRERIGLPHGIVAQFLAGVLHGDAALRALGSIADEEHPRALSAWLSAVDDAWPMLASAEALPGLRAWLRRALEPAKRRLGTEAPAGEGAVMAEARARLLRTLGERGRDPELLALARTKAASILADPGAVAPDMIETWLELAAVEGDAALFEAYAAKHDALKAPAERKRYLDAIASFRDPGLTRRALDFTLGGSVPAQEIGGVLFDMVDDAERGAPAYAWLKERYAEIEARTPPFMRVYLPAIAGGCDVARVRDARTFFLAPERVAPGMERTLDQVEDATRTCETVRSAERERVVAFVGAAR